MIGEEVPNQTQKDPTSDLFGPSVDAFIKSRKDDKRKKATGKPRGIKYICLISIAHKLPENIAGMYAEAQRCYIMEDFNRVDLLNGINRIRLKRCWVKLQRICQNTQESM